MPMALITLNLRQKKLIQQLAELKQTKQLAEPFTPFPLGLMNYIVYLRSRYNLRIQWVSDLEVLCLAGYLDYEWNRMWTAKKYSLSEQGMAILDDKTFITAEDYARERSSQSMSQLFVDGQENPPSDQSLDHLFSADLDKLTHALKQAMGKTFSGIELGDRIGELNRIDAEVRSATADLNKKALADSIKTLGQEILHTVNGDFSTIETQQAVHTLAVYSLWSKAIARKLAA